MAQRTNRKKSRTDDDAAREHEDTVRKGYEAAQQPERQGDGDPGTQPVGEDNGEAKSD